MGGRMNFVKKVVSGFDALFHPACCDLCHSYHEFPVYWICESCWQRVSRELIPAPKAVTLDDKFSLIVHAGWQFHEEIQQVIHCLKYRKHNSIAPFISTALAERLAITLPDKSFDFIIPVPLHKKRKAWRGFNQSELIAECIVCAQEKLQLADALERRRLTGAQASLTRQARFENVEDAFGLKKQYYSQLKGKSILLIDDVVTTGATAAACISALRKAGIGEIRMIAIAYVGGNYLPESVIV